jgi:asparagine synthase (glutamine-hydrolysing)
MLYRKGIEALAGGNILNQTILQDQQCDLMQWFWRADRMGMAESMELRVPFCTVPMFKAANAIPYSQRVMNGEKKAILKKIAEKYIDKDQIYRKKIGFGTPVDDWINKNGVYSGLYDTTVCSEAFKNRQFINYKHFSDIYEAHKSGRFREVNSGFLWTYFSLELWYKIFFEGQWRQFC